MQRVNAIGCRLLILIIAISAVRATAPAEGAAQEEVAVPAEREIAERCRDSEYRQFDFWIGEWEVRSDDGELLGHNEVRSVSTGCGLLENWRGATGGRGVSVNTYAADRGVWTQRWVGAGSTLWLEGGLEDGAMVLTGTTPRSTPDGDLLDRITWTPLSDGRVRQRWDVSTNRGESWEPIFVGFYERIDDGGT